MSALFLLLCPQDSHPFPSGHSEYCSQVTLSRLSVSQKCVWRWNISIHSELPQSLWSAYAKQGTLARTGCDLDDCLCLCVSQSAAVLPKAPAPTSPKLVTTSRRETFFFPSFLPTLWSSDPWKVVIFWSDCVSSLLPPVYVSMLEDDLKLSSSEDSDGEQDPAKNASRNTLGRWAGSTASFTR